MFATQTLVFSILKYIPKDLLRLFQTCSVSHSAGKAGRESPSATAGKPEVRWLGQTYSTLGEPPLTRMSRCELVHAAWLPTAHRKTVEITQRDTTRSDDGPAPRPLRGSGHAGSDRPARWPSPSATGVGFPAAWRCSACLGMHAPCQTAGNLISGCLTTSKMHLKNTVLIF